MRFLRRRTLIIALLPALLGACGAVQPHGALKDVVEGKIFENTPSNPAEEKAKEDSRRQLERQTPQPEEPTGPVQFRIPL
jgi:hypothetical protein